MKKIVFSLVLLVFMINCVFAVSTDIKENYLPAETAIIKISGNILESISPADIEFKRGHVLVPFDYDVGKIGEEYYLWFITPEGEINYTLGIKNIATTVNGKVQEITYEKNFTVSGNLSDYSVKPGFISTNDSFEIRVVLNEDLSKAVTLNFFGESEFTLKPGENIVKFPMPEINETQSAEIILGKYTLPAYLKVDHPVKITPGESDGAKVNLTNLSEIDIEELPEEEQEAIKVERQKHNCIDYPGVICAADETCSKEIIVAADGQCCVGIEAVCVQSNESSGGMAWIGYLLGAIVIIAGVFFWIKYKKVKADENPLDKKIQAFGKRTP